MSDAIKVGDRVETLGHRTGYVQGIYGNRAWVLFASHELNTLYLSDLTRIEPEPVVLTPKYGVGQRVNFIGQGKVHLAGVEVGYHIEKWGGLWAESLLEPIPEPCPTCKGSGVSEGGA